MSETDSFIDEVTEEVRRDRLFALMRKYGWIGILIVVLIVGGAAWNEWRKARDRAEAQAFGDSVLAALKAEDPARRLEKLDEMAATVAEEPGRLAVTRLLAADEALRAGDRAGALERVQAVAEEPGLPASLRQLAQLKAVILAGPDMPAAEREAILSELAAPGAPYRALAMEEQALALLAAGQRDEAVAMLRRILEEPDLTQGLQSRVSQLIVVLGGEAAAG
ncbi:tetratricopeptide repeat protein [Albidovulum sp.]